MISTDDLRTSPQRLYFSLISEMLATEPAFVQPAALQELHHTFSAFSIKLKIYVVKSFKTRDAWSLMSEFTTLIKHLSEQGFVIYKMIQHKVMGTSLNHSYSIILKHIKKKLWCEPPGFFWFHPRK